MQVCTETDHRCKKNWHKDVEIRFEKINKEEWSWVLDQAWIATKIEFDTGHAEEEGEQICRHILLINHCPFCGLNLNDVKRNTW